MPESTENQSGNAKHIVCTLVICAAVALAAMRIIELIHATAPTAQKSGATRKSSALVEVIYPKRGDYRPVIKALGTVEPAREIQLSPRVSGQVISMAKGFIPGGFVNKGELLLEIDPADFRNNLAMRRSELHQAQAERELELGQQRAAQQEFALLGEEIKEANRALILREPQIRSAQARVESAQTEVDMAKLNLSRTRLHAPFDAQILSRSVNIGSQVSPGNSLARLVGIDEYWIIASVPQEDLQWIQFPIKGEPGATVEITKSGAWDEGVSRTGEVQHLIGVLDNETRLARLLMSVKDPLSRQTEEPMLLLGTMVETHIAARLLEDVFRLDRDYLRRNDTIWMYNRGKLNIRKVHVVFRDLHYVYIRDGFEEGEAVVSTNLATISDGIPLRVENNNTRAGEHP
ncbi:efflux RND transporter periplasmic adaptor subunit [Candidatus Electrothrix sp.]|uniref:efflux RND transporter periplasmic adaptor subunit n=1 Tax=Candidatus Electrothrix sp. TaxID=2170559 RepID=UPI0040565308